MLNNRLGDGRDVVVEEQIVGASGLGERVYRWVVVCWIVGYTGNLCRCQSSADAVI